MDSPGRSFLSLLGLASVLATYSLCGFVALIVLPLIEGAAPSHGSVLCLLPAASLGGVLMTATWRGGRSMRANLIASRKLGERIEATAIRHPPRLGSAVASADLRGRVDLVDEEGAFSFSYGLLAPRIAISSGLLDRLSDQELRAALEHERYHVRNLDPLRSLIAAAVSDGFFLLPYLSVLRARYEAGRELAADLCAERACGRRALLAALVKALDGSDPGQAIGPSLAAPALLDARVRRLETGRNPRLPRLDLPTLARSVYGGAALTALFALALLGLGGVGALQQAASTELEARTDILGLACLVPLFALPALALWRLRQRARRAPEGTQSAIGMIPG
jgi:Zn-dependent protease with chaperone function